MANKLVIDGTKATTVTMTAAEVATVTALGVAQAAATVTDGKVKTNDARAKTLATIAAKYAKDPTGNPALTARQQHELLARIVLSIAADD
jgi:hypothetical protein